MKHYREFTGYFGDIIEINKKHEQIDNTIYTFDIESTSFYILNNKIYPAVNYLELSEKEQKECTFGGNMYIWQFSINNVVYYGRTWKEFKIFLDKLEYFNPNKKIVFVHNLAFEFHFLKSVFNFKNVMARKSHKVMNCEFCDYNIQLRCTYYMTNASLEEVPKLFGLDVNKLVGNLDYTKLRHSNTKLTEKELAYCEYDCLVLYKYIKKELETYENVYNIPFTSTGKVRRELKEKIKNDWDYKNSVKKATNSNPHVYNLLMEAFMRWLYTCKLDLYR